MHTIPYAASVTVILTVTVTVKMNVTVTCDLAACQLACVGRGRKPRTNNDCVIHGACKKHIWV
jgi:hypothetical protein